MLKEKNAYCCMVVSSLLIVSKFKSIYFMKKLLLLAFASMFCMATVNAQRTLIDFDNESQSFVECFGNGSQGLTGCLNEIDNPDASGINTSGKVGEFIEPAEGETWMGLFFDVVNGGDVDLTAATGNTFLCADIWTPTAVPFTFKVEKVVDGTTALDYEGGQIMPSATSEWVSVCDDMASFNEVANRLVFFFNIGALPATTTSYYFDNVIQMSTSNVDGLLEERGLAIYPNPATHNLLFTANGEPMDVVVSDLSGRELIRHNNYYGDNVRVSDLTPGMYVITFIERSTGRFGSAKFVKK